MTAAYQVGALQLVAAARSLLGVPFHHQGRNEHGLDCIGLVLLSCRRAGFDLLEFCGIQDSRNYGTGVNPRAVELLRSYCAAEIEAPEPGCLVVFQYPGESAPRHQGLMTEAGTFVHANRGGVRSRWCVIETAYRGIWIQRTHSFWRLPGVRYGA